MKAGALNVTRANYRNTDALDGVLGAARNTLLCPRCVPGFRRSRALPCLSDSRKIITPHQMHSNTRSIHANGRNRDLWSDRQCVTNAEEEEVAAPSCSARKLSDIPFGALTACVSPLSLRYCPLATRAMSRCRPREPSKSLSETWKRLRNWPSLQLIERRSCCNSGLHLWDLYAST